jgi:hypothetical protein
MLCVLDKVQLEHHVEQEVVDKYRPEVNLFGNFFCRAPI